ncbi:transcriptional regulator (plasmid) [Rahnella aquatilis CIP 78.65 = ATCC 33071]|uniref:Transcriptional regulator n=2 Tax=Rahnella aquatilis TaxID=34038 RepID=H2J2H0_RAHAC|nr:transcriptional regulator [Rahnella aquatilis CIP 78.65 = ATCC 33071]
MPGGLSAQNERTILTLYALIKLIKIMTLINPNDFSRIDLNLLVVLIVMYEERNVTQAAQRLHLGQPAVSAALKRLRSMFNEALFVRTTQGMMPTPRTCELIQALTPLMAQLQAVVLNPPRFNPEKDKLTFHIGMSDWIEHWLMPDLLAGIMREAPQVSINAVATDPWKVVSALEQNKVDLSITVGQETSRDLRREKLTSAGFKTLWDPGQIDITKPLTVAQFVHHEHLLISYRGASQSAMDSSLEKAGVSRRVRYVSSHFSTLPLMLSQMPLFATVPMMLVDDWCRQYGFQSDSVPVHMPPFELALLWHRNRDSDAATLWMLNKIRQLIAKKLSAIR